MGETSNESMAEAEFGAVLAAWRRATVAPVLENERTVFRAYRRRTDHGWTWVLEHNGAIVDVTGSIEVLMADHPGARIDVVEAPGGPGE